LILISADVTDETDTVLLKSIIGNSLSDMIDHDAMVGWVCPFLFSFYCSFFLYRESYGSLLLLFFVVVVVVVVIIVVWLLSLSPHPQEGKGGRGVTKDAQALAQRMALRLKESRDQVLGLGLASVWIRIGFQFRFWI
jgi:hypothetical protein